MERGRILPVLDGLDEVPDDRQAGILQALNVGADGIDGFILTSRRPAYLRALSDSGDVLTAAAVIAPLALTPAEACRYLRTQLAPGDRLLDPTRHTAWTDVMARLEDARASDLAAVVANPLGLWLSRTVYVVGRRDPTPLIDRDHPDRAGLPLHDHLLSQLIPAVVRSNPAGRRPFPLRTEAREEAWCRYLTTIAVQLRDGDSRDWLWWRLAPNFFRGLPARLATGLVLGIIASTPFLLVGAVAAAPTLSSATWEAMLSTAVALCTLAESFRSACSATRTGISEDLGSGAELIARVLGGFLVALLCFMVLVVPAAAIDVPA